MTSVRVHLRHVRQAGAGKRTTCASGIRAWCLQNGIDLRQLAHEGLPVEQVVAMPDAFAKRAAQLAIQEATGG